MGEIWLVGIKQNTYPDEHRVLYGIAESLYSIPATNTILYVHNTGIKIKM